MNRNKQSPLIHVENCSKSFSGITVFDNVSFDLYPGEVHCLVGENGAGKSTFIKILSGAYTPDCGEIYVCGELIKHFEPDVLRKYGIQTIYQSQFLMLDLTVSENIYMGDYITSNSGLMDYRKQTEKAKELLDSMELNIDPNAVLGDLNVSDRHSVQIARALAQDAKVLILGRKIYMVGGNKQASYLSGINSNQVTFVAFIYSGLMGAIAGFLLACQVGAALPQASQGTEMVPIAAVILGGVSLSGGKGKISGTILAVLILQIITNGLQLQGIQQYVQWVVTGGVLLLAVFIDVIRSGALKKQ